MDGAFEARMAVRDSIWVVSTCSFTELADPGIPCSIAVLMVYNESFQAL